MTIRNQLWNSNSVDNSRRIDSIVTSSQVDWLTRNVIRFQILHCIACCRHDKTNAMQIYFCMPSWSWTGERQEIRLEKRHIDLARRRRESIMISVRHTPTHTHTHTHTQTEKKSANPQPVRNRYLTRKSRDWLKHHAHSWIILYTTERLQ